MSDAETRNVAGKKWILIGVGGLLAVMLVISLIPDRGRDRVEVEKPKANPTPSADKPSSADTLAERVASLLKEARAAHQDKKWQDAVAKWDALLKEIPKEKPDADRFLIEELEAHRNLAIARQNVKAAETRPKVGEVVEVPERPDEEKPEKLSEDDLIAWYPKGKTVQSIGLLHVRGKGMNRDWGLKGLANFEYVYQVDTETKVTANNAATGRLTFEQFFRDVTQMRAASHKTLELDLPDSLLATVVGNQLDKYLPDLVPGYTLLKRLKQLVEVVDPRMKKSLTTLQGWLHLAESDDVELAVMLDRVAGTRVRVEYVSGIGVVNIATLSNTELSRDELTKLAHASTLLMDYFIFPSANKPVGAQWSVRAADVGNMTLPTMSGTRLTGAIEIHRDDDVMGQDGSKLARLGIVSGKVKLVSDDDAKDQQGELTVDSGVARFSMADKIVRDARLKFQAKLDIKSRNHLLFGTESMRDVSFDSRYEAELVKPAESR